MSKIDMIKEGAMNIAKRVGFKMSKHAPEILVVGGTVGLVAAGVLACKATLKADEVVKEAETARKIIDNKVGMTTHDGEIYEEEDAKKDKIVLTTQTVLKVGRVYAVPLALGGLSVGSILYGHNMRNKRYLAAAAAWAASQADYKALLSRIKEEYGEDAERKLKYGLKETVEEFEEEDGEGNTTSGVREYYQATATPSLYCRIFDEFNPNWSKSSIHNMMFLKNVQEEATRTLRSRGFITLNEVYAALGFDQNPEYGTEAGWILGAGDDFVDFGLYDIDMTEGADRAKKLFVNGYERSVLLDFNCIGRIREHA